MRQVFTALILLSLCIVSARAQDQPDCVQAKAAVTRLEMQLKDWPALARYHDANTKVGPPVKNEKRVVFMGDSITDGWRLADYFPGQPYINRGISGQTTPQMLIRFRPDVIALNPQVVVILAGTNDIAGNTGPMTLEAIENNFASMAELARANGVRVVFASVMPISDYGKSTDGQPVNRTKQRPPEQIKALNAWIRNYAAVNILTYLDYFSALVDDQGFLRAELSNDGLHPNDKGYVVMKPLAERAIAAALKRTR
jgi:lysophospholipase L1-like esterase